MTYKNTRTNNNYNNNANIDNKQISHNISFHGVR